MAFSFFGVLKGLLIQNETDRSKEAVVQVSPSATASTRTTIQVAQTANRTISVPDATDTLVGRNTTDTLTNKSIDADQNTISNIENADIKAGAGIDASKIGDGSVSNAEFQQLGAVTSPIVDQTSAQTLSNKTLDNSTILTIQDSNLTIQDNVDTTKQLKIQASGITTGTTRTLTAPDADTTIVGTDTTQTLTNKTLSGNTASSLVNGSGTLNINSSGTVTIPNGTDTLVSRTSTDTGANRLQNKHLDGSSVGFVGNIDQTKIIAFSPNNLNTASTLSIAPAAATGGGTISLPPAPETLVGRTSSDTLSNKTMGDALTFTQIATPSNPSAGLNKVYPKADGNFYTLNSSGVEAPLGSSGSGSKNYLGVVNNVNGNGNFELGSTTGWSLGNVTLTSNFPSGTPTFGSGASGNLSISAVSSGQLAGNYSLSYASSAATTAGNFVASNAFTIDSEDQAKVLTVKFYYKAQTNPSNANWSGTSSNSFGIALYDVTTGGSAGWIQPAGVWGMTQSSGVGIATATFQTTSASTQYRLVVFNANATSGAVTVYFDDMSVSPQTAPIGAVATDWQAFTPTGSWVANTTYSGFKRRVGDTEEVQVYITLAGAPTATGLTITTPSSIDYNKLTGGQVFDAAYLGTGYTIDSAAVAYQAAYVEPTDTANVLRVTYEIASTTNTTTAPISNTAPFTYGSGDTVVLRFSYPVAGWSSQVQMSNDTDTRVVSAYYYINSSASQTANDPINYAVKVIDTHSAVTTGSGTWSYLVPVSGTYRISHTGHSTSGTTDLFLSKNGTNVQWLGTVGAINTVYSGSSLISCNAGDSLSVRTNATFTAGGLVSSSPVNSISIERLSGPAVVAATESINTVFLETNGQSIANGAQVIVNFNSKQYDTHGAVTDGASWKFTAPVSGKYDVSALVQFTTASFTNNTNLAMLMFINNSSAWLLDQQHIWASATVQPSMLSGSGIIKMNAGDFIDIRVSHGEGAARSLVSGQSTIHISRIGD